MDELMVPNQWRILKGALGPPLSILWLLCMDAVENGRYELG